MRPLLILPLSKRKRPDEENSPQLQRPRQHPEDKLKLTDLPPDILLSIIEVAMGNYDDICTDLKKWCSVNQRFSGMCTEDDFWKLACKVRKYDREDRVSGFHQMETGSPMPWKQQFRKWCKLRFTSRDHLRTAIYNILDMDKTGAANHELYGFINTWDVSSVTTMDSMFRNAYAFNQPLEGWDVSNVTTMEDMFRHAHAFNRPLEGWNVSSVTTMEMMFWHAHAFNQPLEGWNVSSVTTMESMFWRADAFNQPLNGWNVSSVAIMESIRTVRMY